MTVRIEKNGAVWTVIHDRPEARNAMDPASADALTQAFLEFDADPKASVAVFYGAGGAFCAGWDLKYCQHARRRPSARRTRYSDRRTTRQRRRNPARAARTLAARIGQASDRRDRGPSGRRRHGAGTVVRFSRDGARLVFRRILPPLGRAADRWRNGAVAAYRRSGPRAGNHSYRTQGSGRGMSEHRPLRISRAQRAEPGRKPRSWRSDIARFPQVCVRADRRSAIKSHGLSVRDALIQEWYNGREALVRDGVAGATRFKDGLGRHGDFRTSGKRVPPQFAVTNRQPRLDGGHTRHCPYNARHSRLARSGRTAHG